ncbi:MAG: type II toxin-antitoxin system RelE/ParE family toxin [Silvibacterium sp.]
MDQYQLTSKAKEDLFAILDYIAADNPAAADRVEAAMLESCNFLASTPHAGHIRLDLTTRPVRFWCLPRFPNYLLVYDPASKLLTVLRIFHAARDLTQHLEP